MRIHQKKTQPTRKEKSERKKEAIKEAGEDETRSDTYIKKRRIHGRRERHGQTDMRAGETEAKRKKREGKKGMRVSMKF